MEDASSPLPKIEWTSSVSGVAIAVPRQDTRDAELLHIAHLLHVPQALLSRLPDLPNGSPAYVVGREFKHYPGAYESDSPLWKRHCGYCGDLCVPPSPSRMRFCGRCGVSCCDQCCLSSESTSVSPICSMCIEEFAVRVLTKRMKLISTLRKEFDDAYGYPLAPYSDVELRSSGFPYVLEEVLPEEPVENQNVH